MLRMGSGNDKGQEARLWGPDNQGKSAARPKSGAAAPGVSAPRHWRSGRETFGGTNMVHRRFAACDLSNKGEAQSGGAITLQAQEKIHVQYTTFAQHLRHTPLAPCAL